MNLQKKCFALSLLLSLTLTTYAGITPLQYPSQCPKPTQIQTEIITSEYGSIRYWHAIINGIYFSGKNKLGQKVSHQTHLTSAALQGQAVTCTYYNGGDRDNVATMTNNGDAMGKSRFVKQSGVICYGTSNDCKFILIGQ